MLLLMLLSLYQVETPLGSWVNRLVFVLLFSPLGLVAFLKLLTPMGKLVSTPWVGSAPQFGTPPPPNQTSTINCVMSPSTSVNNINDYGGGFDQGGYDPHLGVFIFSINLKNVAGKCSPIANGQDAPCIDLTIDSSAAHRTLPVPLNLV